MEFKLANLKDKHTSVIPQTPNFYWDEVLQNNLESYVCGDRDFNYIKDPGVMRNIIQHALMLEEYREWFNRPINIESWHRPDLYNDVVMIENNYHTSEDSDHKCINSCAVDTDVEASFSNIQKWKDICVKYNLSWSIGVYDWGLHLGWRRGQKNRSWTQDWYK